MDLHLRLRRYEVTALPPRARAARLAWSTVDLPGSTPPVAEPSFAVLDAYRITRVPRLAS